MDLCLAQAAIFNRETLQCPGGPGGPDGPGLSHSICAVPESRALLEQTPSPDFELLQGLLQFEALHVKDLMFIDVS